MVEGGKGGFEAEVVHWDAGEDYVNPGGGSCSVGTMCAIVCLR
jgi:hypothetical protein